MISAVRLPLAVIRTGPSQEKLVLDVARKMPQQTISNSPRHTNKKFNFFNRSDPGTMAERGLDIMVQQCNMLDR